MTTLTSGPAGSRGAGREGREIEAVRRLRERRQQPLFLEEVIDALTVAREIRLVQSDERADQRQFA